MTLLVLSCLWVLTGTVVALLPMRYQFVPGALLLLAAPVLIYMIGRDVAPGAGVMAALAFVSMFRRPLRFYALRAIGRKPEVTKCHFR